MDNFEDFVLIIPPGVLWGVFLFVIIVFITLTLILSHHWKYYGIKDNPNIFIKTLHWFISIPLFIIMLVALLVYEAGL